jgi:hypothetical protein
MLSNKDTAQREGRCVCFLRWKDSTCFCADVEERWGEGGEGNWSRCERV